MENINKKEDIIEFLKLTFVTILTISVLISFVWLSFLGTTNNLEEKKFISELSYLERLVKAALFNNKNIKSIEDLKTEIDKDQQKIQDFRKRGILDDLNNNYSDLNSFRKSEKKPF